MYIVLWLSVSFEGESRRLVQVEGNKQDACMVYRYMRAHHEHGGWKWPESQITGHNIQPNKPEGDVDVSFDQEDLSEIRALGF